jgi:hypothetical protein
MHAGNVPAARSRSPRAFPRRLEGIEGAPNNARRSPRLASRLVPAAGRRRTSNSCGCSRPFPQAPPPAFPSRRRSPPPPSSLPRATSTSRARLGRDAPSATRDARLFRAPRSPRETERAPSERETRAKKGGAIGAHGKRVDRRGVVKNSLTFLNKRLRVYRAFAMAAFTRSRSKAKLAKVGNLAVAAASISERYTGAAAPAPAPGDRGTSGCAPAGIAPDP